jgi:hypothetical protein
MFVEPGQETEWSICLAFGTARCGLDFASKVGYVPKYLPTVVALFEKSSRTLLGGENECARKKGILRRQQGSPIL